MKKRLMALSMAAAVSVGLLAGCGTNSGGAPTPQDGKPYIAVVAKGFQHQFWQANRNCCRHGKRH